MARSALFFVLISIVWFGLSEVFVSTASGALVVGLFQKFLITSPLASKNPGDSSECSMEKSQSANDSLLQSVVVCGSLW